MYSSRYFLNSLFFFRSLNINNRLIIKNFDRKTFDYLSSRRLERFNGNQEQMLKTIRINLESLLKTSSIHNYLINFNSKNFTQFISIEQFNDILYYAYEHNLKLDLLIKHLLKYISPSINERFSINFYFELINLLVLHQQKYYDYQTKNSNEILKNLIYHLELNLTNDQIRNFSLIELSLLCSAMYRLQLPLKNENLLQFIGQYLINDQEKKFLSAVDKQNFIKILTLSNYKQINIVKSLINRFNQSFEQNLQLNLTLFSYEIVRMTMRIGIYLSLCHFYEEKFFQNCLKLIELESNSSQLSYRAKDIIQIMNTLIMMGYLRKINLKYMNLIDMYDQMNQFDQKPERLVDVLAPLASINYFPDHLLKKLFTKENLQQLTESRFKEKLFFISKSYEVFHSSSQTFLDQNYLDSLPHHIFGSWNIEKKKRPNFSLIIQRLVQCVPNRIYVKTAFLLKHFKSPNIIIRLNIDQEPQIISHIINEDNCSMYALEVLSEDELCINKPLRPLGLFYSKAYQLQKLNYKPVFIYPKDILHDLKTTKEVFEWINQRAQTTELLLNEN